MAFFSRSLALWFFGLLAVGVTFVSGSTVSLAAPRGEAAQAPRRLLEEVSALLRSAHSLIRTTPMKLCTHLPSGHGRWQAQQRSSSGQGCVTPEQALQDLRDAYGVHAQRTYSGPAGQKDTLRGRLISSFEAAYLELLGSLDRSTEEDASNATLPTLVRLVSERFQRDLGPGLTLRVLDQGELHQGLGPWGAGVVDRSQALDGRSNQAHQPINMASSQADTERLLLSLPVGQLQASQGHAGQAAPLQGSGAATEMNQFYWIEVTWKSSTKRP